MNNNGDMFIILHNWTLWTLKADLVTKPRKGHRLINLFCICLQLCKLAYLTDF